MHPKAWDIEELILAKALNVGTVRIPDLKNNLHRIFLPGRWQVTKEEYEALVPSMRLASHLIEISITYLSNFLPSDQLHQVLAPKTRNADGSCSGYTVHLRTDNVSPRKLEETRAELNAVSEIVFWQVNYEMYQTLSWQGITRTVFDAPRPWAEILPEETMTSDTRLKSQGYTRRPLTIGIMGEYVMALRQLTPGSEAHLRAIFLAAITMTHEVSHLVFQQDFRSLDYDPTQGYEPWVERDCWADLGLSCVGWIFSGYNPMPCVIGSIDYPWDFQAPLAWFKQFTIDEQPLYETAYSIGVPYLEEILSTTFWDSLGVPDASRFSKEAKRRLKPATGSVEPQPATAMLPQWKWTRLESASWKTKFNDRRVGSRPMVTPDEIQWEQAQLRIQYPHSRPTLWNGDPNPRINLLDVADEDEDGEFGVGPSAKLYLGRNLNSLRLADLPPREMDDGFISPDLPGYQGGSANVLLTVRYRPERVLARPPISHSKKYMNSPNDPEKGERFNGEGYDPNDLTTILHSKVDHKISRMTHEQAFKYCKARGIRFGLGYEDDETWQKSRLDRSNYKEQGLIQRIKQYSFHRLQERFRNPPSEVVQVKEFASPDSDWVNEDLMWFCRTHGLNTSGDIQDRMQRVRNWIGMDFEGAWAALSVRDAAKFVQTVGGYQILNEDDVTKWTKADLMAFFSKNKLPTWGSRDTWEQRVLRSRDEETACGEVSRWAINQDALVRRTNYAKGNNQMPAPDPSLKRTYDIMEGNVAPTITERIQQVGQLASRLMQATEAGGGREILHPHLNGRKSTSGAEILDNLENMEEVQEQRREALKRAVGGGKENEVPSDGGDGAIPRGHEGTFMAETYRSIDSHCS